MIKLPTTRAKNYHNWSTSTLRVYPRSEGKFDLEWLDESGGIKRAMFGKTAAYVRSIMRQGGWS